MSKTFCVYNSYYKYDIYYRYFIGNILTCLEVALICIFYKRRLSIAIIYYNKYYYYDTYVAAIINYIANLIPQAISSFSAHNTGKKLNIY